MQLSRSQVAPLNGIFENSYFTQIPNFLTTIDSMSANQSQTTSLLGKRNAKRDLKESSIEESHVCDSEHLTTSVSYV